MRNKKVLLFVSVFICVIFVAMRLNNVNKKTQNPNILGHDSVPRIDSMSQDVVELENLDEALTDAKSEIFLEKIKSFCPEVKSLIGEGPKVKSAQTFGHNIHFKKGDAVFRIRVFNEDRPEGSHQKMIYYKEDSDGFAHIQKLNKELSMNPTPKSIKDLIGDSIIIHDARDINLIFENEKELNLSIVNNQIERINAGSFQCE